MSGTNWQLYPALTGALASADTFLALQASDHSASSAGTVHQVTPAQLAAAMVSLYGMQRGFDVVIAPSDASAQFKGAADVVLTGSGDQSAINTALAALPGAGRALLGPGTVSLTDKITVDQGNVELHGCGYATYVQAAAGFNASAAALVHIGTAAVLTGNVVTGLQLDGNHGTASGSAVGLLASASQILVERVEVKNSCGDSYYFQAHDGTTALYEIGMRDCYAWSPAGYGVHIGATVDNSEFHRVFAVGSNQGTPVTGSSDGFYVAGSDCKFLQCHPYFNAGNGMTIASGCANITVVDGEYETNTGYGIKVEGADHVTVTAGASFYANGSGSIAFATTGANLQAQVSGCKFHDLGTTATTVISADANTYQLAVSGCTFDCATGSALTSIISLAVQGASVTGNILRSNNSAVNSVYLNGATYVKIIGNYLDGPVTEASGADYNDVIGNGWNNTLTTYFTFTGAHSSASSNQPAPEQAAGRTVLGTPFSSGTGTSAQNVTGMSATVGAGTWEITAWVPMSPHGTTGGTQTLAWTFGGTTSAAAVSWTISGTSTTGAGGTSLTTASAASPTMTSAGMVGLFTGRVTVTASGTLQLTVKSGTSGDECTIPAGAWMQVKPVTS